jgi:hypothetical protein
MALTFFFSFSEIQDSYRGPATQEGVAPASSTSGSNKRKKDFDFTTATPT